MMNLKSATLLSICTFLMGCDPILGTWNGIEYCNGSSETSCSVLPQEQGDKTLTISMIIEGDLKGTFIVQTIDEPPEGEATTSETETPFVVEVQDAENGSYSIILSHDEGYDQTFSCLLEEKELTCIDDVISYTFEK